VGSVGGRCHRCPVINATVMGPRQGNPTCSRGVAWFVERPTVEPATAPWFKPTVGRCVARSVLFAARYACSGQVCSQAYGVADAYSGNATVGG